MKKEKRMMLHPITSFLPIWNGGKHIKFKFSPIAFSSNDSSSKIIFFLNHCLNNLN